MPIAAQEPVNKTIPLLLSEHHADHMEWFFRHGADSTAAMIVLDTHFDTAANDQYNLIRELAAKEDYSQAGAFASNHNWIHALAPSPLNMLIWISTIQGHPRNDKLQGFYKSMDNWSFRIDCDFTSLIDEVQAPFFDITREAGKKTLFVSVDLDFFYSENHSPQDVFYVLYHLLAFSKDYQEFGDVVWAICLSRPWLPDDNYAWALLERTFSWLLTCPEFSPLELSLFNSRRIDTSRTAEAYRAEGRAVPVLRIEDAPEHVMELFKELQQ